METTSAYEIGNWAAASLESGVTVCVTSEYLLIGSVTVAYAHIEYKYNIQPFPKP
jgi:hypothetical protein